MERKSSKTQTYQIHISTNKKLLYEAYTLNGELYNAFELLKRSDGSNELINKIPDTSDYK